MKTDNKIKFLDGAMGSELIKRGFTLHTHTWTADANIYNAHLVCQIHAEYIESGANYITTNTFRSTPRAYLKTGLSQKESIRNAYHSFNSAINIANQAANNKTDILVSIAPLEDCYLPNLFPGKDEALFEFSNIKNWIENKNVYGIILETMNNIAEICTAIEVFSTLNLPIWLSIYMINSLQLASKEYLVDLIQIIKNCNVKKILINCSNIEVSLSAVNNLVNICNIPWGIYPNIGLGQPSPNGKINNIISDHEFINFFKQIKNLNPSIIGCCCGSSPHHIKLLKKI